MDDVERLILRAALAPSPDAFADWFEFKTSTPLDAMPNILNSCGGYIYKNLIAAEQNDDYLKGIFKQNWAANTYRLQRLIPLLTVISNKVQITPIKSFGLNSKHFNLGLRSIGDFDFYFAQADFKAIKRILKNYGYTPFMEISEEELRDKILISRGSWSFKNGPIDDLDLHWKIFDELSISENRAIILENSKIRTSNWGHYREMSNELSAVTISHHHFLNGGMNYTGLCDLHNILKVSDISVVKKLAKRVNMLEILETQNQNIDEIGHNRVLSIWNQEPKVGVISIAQILPFVQSATLRNSFIYKLWLKMGGSDKFERLILAVLRSFSHPHSYMKDAISWIELSPGVRLGVGWHYRYPGHDYQWSTYPDTRILLRSMKVNKMKMSLDLDPHTWSISVPQTVQCYLNGKLVHSFGKETCNVNFEIETRNGWNEISFRSPKPWNLQLDTISYNWQRLQMPVRRIWFEPYKEGQNA